MKPLFTKTATLAGAAILSAMVVVFDYTMKFSGFKIPFPPLTILKFDFTGIPIVLALLLYGFPSGTITSIIASLAILARSGNFISSPMRGLSEFSQVLGMAIGIRLGGRFRKAMSFVLGIALRCIITNLANIFVFPFFYGMPFELVVSLLPLMILFNAMLGALNIFVGYLLYELLIRRISSLKSL